MRNKVFIAVSFDGYIADEHGGIEWLTDLPNPSTGDGGFSKFMESVDALVMGRATFEKVLSFGIEWPYSKKVFVWTSALDRVPAPLEGRAEIVRGQVTQVLERVHALGFNNLYIDGGKTIQSFMRAGWIHEITVTVAPIVLGRGIPLFGDLPKTRMRLLGAETLDNGMVQLRYEISG